MVQLASRGAGAASASAAACLDAACRAAARRVTTPLGFLAWFSTMATLPTLLSALPAGQCWGIKRCPPGQASHCRVGREPPCLLLLPRPTTLPPRSTLPPISPPAFSSAMVLFEASASGCQASDQSGQNNGVKKRRGSPLEVQHRSATFPSRHMHPRRVHPYPCKTEQFLVHRAVCPITGLRSSCT